MTEVVYSGPLVTAPSNPLGSTGTGSANQNPQSAPNFWLHGDALIDPRTPFTYKPGSGSGPSGNSMASRPVYGWYGTTCQVINAVPSTISAVNIAATQAAAATITLVSSSGAGITVGVSITNAVSGATVTGLLAIDTAMAGQSYGQDAKYNVWDPTKAISRNVRITSAGDDSGKTFTVVGYDLYGYPMSEVITGANAGVASGLKAFKYIASVTPSTTPAGNVSVGTGDVIGLPLRSDYFGDLRIVYNNAAITASTGYTAADTTSPATTTTGDVRGTYALQTASNNSRRLQVFLSPPAANCATVTGLLGVAQNLSTTNGS